MVKLQCLGQNGHETQELTRRGQEAHSSMKPIETIEALTALYGEPSAAALKKETGRLTDDYAAFITDFQTCFSSNFIARPNSTREN